MKINEPEIIGQSEDGKVTGLCFLASVNMNHFYSMLPAFDFNTCAPVEPVVDFEATSERKAYIKRVVKALDNTIETDHYPVKEGVEEVAKAYRYIGVGTHNYATLLAELDIRWDSQDAKELTAYIYDIFSQDVISASIDLAIERGAAEGWTAGHTKWGETLPYWQGNAEAKKLFKYQPDTKALFDLNARARKYGVRNCQMMAIAPTACQDINGTIKTPTGTLTIKEILNNGGYDDHAISDIIEDGRAGWIKLDAPIQVLSRNGTDTVDKIWYNGKQIVKTIYCKDGSVITATLNHRLHTGEQWKEVHYLGIGNKLFKPGNKDFHDRYTEIIAITCDVHKPVDTWDVRCEEHKVYLTEYGILSHNTSGKAAGMSEGIDPVANVFRREGGTVGHMNAIHDDPKVMSQYDNAFSIPDKVIMELAAIRQLFIDQGQSLTYFCNNAAQDKESARKVIDEIFLAQKLGLKSLYYVRFKKEDGKDETECESCT